MLSARQDHRVRRGRHLRCRAHKERQARRAQPEMPVRRERKVRPGQPEVLDLRVLQVLKEPQVHRVLSVRLVSKDRRAPASRALKARPAPRGRQALRARPDRPVVWGLKVRPALKVRQVHRDQLERRVQSVLRARSV